MGTRDFIDAFQIRGPGYGDVVRTTIDRFVAAKKMLKINVSKGKLPRYRYDWISVKE